MTQIGGDSAVACLYAIARSTSLTAVRSENFFRGKVMGGEGVEEAKGAGAGRDQPCHMAKARVRRRVG